MKKRLRWNDDDIVDSAWRFHILLFHRYEYAVVWKICIKIEKDYDMVGINTEINYHISATDGCIKLKTCRAWMSRHCTYFLRYYLSWRKLNCFLLLLKSLTPKWKIMVFGVKRHLAGLQSSHCLDYPLSLLPLPAIRATLHKVAVKWTETFLRIVCWLLYHWTKHF